MLSDAWDTCSIVSLDLVNAALSDGRDHLIRRVTCVEDGTAVDLTLGTWQMLPGPTGQTVTLAIPCHSGHVQIPGQDRLRFDGVTLIAEMTLRLRATDRGQELVFDTGQSDAPGCDAPIKIVELPGCARSIGANANRKLMDTLSACLSRHAARISFVFAKISGTRSNTTAPLDSNHHGWSVSRMPSGHTCLVLAASRQLTEAQTPDPIPLDGVMDAGWAMSHRCFVKKLVQTAIAREFGRPVRFAASQGQAVLKTPLPLGSYIVGFTRIEPVLCGLRLAFGADAIEVSANVETDLPIWTRLDSIVSLRVPHSDPGIGTSPVSVDSRISKIGAATGTIALIEDTLASLVRARIRAVMATMASQIDRLQQPAHHPVQWAGLARSRDVSIGWQGGPLVVEMRTTAGTVYQAPPGPQFGDQQRSASG